MNNLIEMTNTEINELVKNNYDARFEGANGEKLWKDHNGYVFPNNRVSKTERKRELTATKLLSTALKLSRDLAQIKKDFVDKSWAIFVSECQEKEQNPDLVKGKGNYTWYNLNKAIRIEVNVNEQISFSEAEIKMCQAKLKEFFDAKIGDNSDLQIVKQIVQDAFLNNSRGNLDTRKVLSLLAYKSRVKDANFTQAMELLEASIERNKSRTYVRIAVLNDEQGYDYVNMNVSSV